MKKIVKFEFSIYGFAHRWVSEYTLYWPRLCLADYRQTWRYPQNWKYI